jgi:hypothetical protein
LLSPSLCCHHGVVVTIATLPSTAGGRRHTSAIQFATFFHFLIIDCFSPWPQLFALATTPTTAAMFASADTAAIALTALVTNATAAVIALTSNIAAVLT